MTDFSILDADLNFILIGSIGEQKMKIFRVAQSVEVFAKKPNKVIFGVENMFTVEKEIV